MLVLPVWEEGRGQWASWPLIMAARWLASPYTIFGSAVAWLNNLVPPTHPPSSSHTRYFQCFKPELFRLKCFDQRKGMHPKVSKTCGLLTFLPDKVANKIEFWDQQCLWHLCAPPAKADYICFGWVGRSTTPATAQLVFKLERKCSSHTSRSIPSIHTLRINFSLLHTELSVLLLLLLTFIFRFTWGLWFCTASGWPGWHSWGAWGGCAPRGRGGGGWWRGWPRCSRCQMSSKTRLRPAPARLRRWCGRSPWCGREKIPLFCAFVEHLRETSQGIDFYKSSITNHFIKTMISYLS